jgi:hypothetical protein
MQQYNFNTTAIDPSLGVNSFLNAMRAGQDIRTNQQAYDANAQNQDLAKRNYDYQLEIRNRLAELQPKIGTDANARLEYLSLLEPEKAKIISAEVNKQQQDQRDSGATIALQAVMAAKNGDFEAAQKLLTNRADAYEAGGNTDAATKLRAQAANIQKDPAVVSMLETGALYASPDIFQNYLKQNSQPSENKLREGQAAEASAKATESPSNIAKNQAQARTYDATAALDELQAKYSGNGKLMNPKDVLQAEADFRKEYSTQTAYFQQVHQYYSNVLASPVSGGATGASDIALVYNFMKMLDPTSVVREGEYATAQNSGGVSAQVLSVYNSIVSGQKLTTTQRQNMISQAKVEYGQALAKEKTVRDGITRIATAKGFDPDNLFYETRGVSEPKAPGSSPTVPATVAPVAVPDAPPPGSVVRKKG